MTENYPYDVYLVFTILGFFLLVICDKIAVWQPLNTLPIVSNSGSIMRYWIHILILVSCTFSFDLIYYHSGYVPPNEDLRKGIFILVNVVNGILIGKIVLLRVHDAGKSRWYAFLVWVPFVNVGLILLPPKFSATRPPYKPADKKLRIIIGLLAVSVCLFMWLERKKFENKVMKEAVFTESEIINMVEAQLAAEYPDLPIKVDDITTLDSYEVDPEKRMIVYNMGLHFARLTETMKANLKTTVSENAGKLLCVDPIIIKYDWNVMYTYTDSDKNFYDGVVINKQYCDSRPKKGVALQG